MVIIAKLPSNSTNKVLIKLPVWIRQNNNNDLTCSQESGHT